MVTMPIVYKEQRHGVLLIELHLKQHLTVIWQSEANVQIEFCRIHATTNPFIELRTISHLWMYTGIPDK